MAESFPPWAAREVAQAEWHHIDTLKASGSVLEVSSDGERAEVQMYDPLPDGRFIASMDLAQGSTLGLQKGVVYLFEFKVFSVGLSRMLGEYLHRKYDVTIDSLYRFELVSAEPFPEE